ncbi:MAG: hypothetical protein [Microviridae sp.]|nr:MAG: hypothetical protein [Microviridae sp.]
MGGHNRKPPTCGFTLSSESDCWPFALAFNWFSKLAAMWLSLCVSTINRKPHGRLFQNRFIACARCSCACGKFVLKKNCFYQKVVYFCVK